MADTAQSDIIVAGTGPAGMIAALGLAREGFSVLLAGPPARRDDGRTTALMMPALHYLDSIGLPAFPADVAAPLASMRIVDATRRLIRSAPVTFRAAEIDEPAFGMNIPNKALNAMLEAAVEAEAGIAWRQTMIANWTISTDRVEAELSDGTRVSGLLAVAADGRASPARAAAGISMRTYAYKQSALVVNFGHSRPHG
ncbi:MAG: FAD-dependent monooxygenase, partial [Mesorhizobium sp.]|nr:FAD-dependent monooxygenase [Mesorhizobium sp.]